MKKNGNNPKLNNAEQAMLALIKKSLFNIDCSLTEAEQLSALEESRKQAVYCLAAQSVSLTGDNLITVQKNAYSNIRRNAKNHYCHSSVHNIMSEAGIPYVILKGAASASYYPQPQLRMMGDVDFLIAPEDIDRATAALEAEGFMLIDDKHDVHIGFKKDGMHYEMHFSPARIPDGKAGAVIQDYLSDIISSSAEVKNSMARFMAPSPFHHGLIMLLHMQKHLLSDGIGLRHLCDWGVFVDSFSNEEFVLTFKDKLDSCGLWNFAVAVSLAAHRAVGLPYRAFMGDNSELAETLLQDIVKGGNFGRNSENRSIEAFFISNRGKGEVRYNRVSQFIRSVNSIIYSKWKITRRAKILLPFAWLYFGMKSVLKIIFGVDKPLHLTKAFEDSRDRKDLYRQLHLFEVDK